MKNIRKFFLWGNHKENIPAIASKKLSYSGLNPASPMLLWRGSFIFKGKDEMKKESCLRAFTKIVGSKSLVINLAMVKALGSIKIAVFFSQLLYWWGKGKKEGWVWKTQKEMEEETTLSRFDQDTAIRKGIKLGILETKREGIPAKRHFKINLVRFLSLFG